MPKPLARPSRAFAHRARRAAGRSLAATISTRPRKPPAAPAWPTDNCPPEVLCGNDPSIVKLLPAHEIGPFAFLAEAEILDLHHADDRIVVVGREDVDVLRADSGLRIKLVAIERPAAAILDRVVGKRVVPLDGRQNARVRQAELFAPVRGAAPETPRRRRRA